MATIAIIGADGSGKTTIANMLVEKPPVKLKYLYMGLNIESSNHSLISSKLIYYYKVYKYKKKQGIKGSLKKQNISLHSLNEERMIDTRGKLGATFRMLNRIAEQLYRQLIAVGYQLRGYNVLYDRHFLFDGAIDEVITKKIEHRMTTRFYHWMLTKVLSKPGLTLFLYAPAEILFERKREANLEYLDMKNQSFMNIGSKLKKFKKIDSTQPLEKVFEDINTEILNYCNRNCITNHKE